MALSLNLFQPYYLLLNNIEDATTLHKRTLLKKRLLIKTNNSNKICNFAATNLSSQERLLIVTLFE